VQPVLLWKSNKHYTLWVCVFVALGIQNELACAILSCGLTGSTIFFKFLSHPAWFLWKKILKGKCVLIFLQFLSEIFLILRRIERHIIKKCIFVFVCSTRYSCQILMKLQFSRKISKTLIYQISWKSVQWDPSCSMRADGRTDGWTGRQTWRG
jgi:hypothetical protein